MEPRLLLAYALITVLALVAAAVGFHLWYNRRDRYVARRRVREQRARDVRMAAREAERG